ncbi:uncharacterized protein gpsm3 [Pholidichthys leucotaenia]
MAEEQLLEALVIIEDGDETEVDAERGAARRSDASGSVVKKEEEPTTYDSNQEEVAAEMCSDKQGLDKQKTSEEGGKPEDGEGSDDGQAKADGESEEGTYEEKPESMEGGKVTENNSEEDKKTLDSAEQQLEDPKKAHQLTPDFPEALYELLCTLQEGRRLNDQRCSFTLESGMRRRRCHSEPNTTKPTNRVIFSSLTSLQKEELFDLVATAQARRLDDQRALLQTSPPPKAKSRSFRGSIKQLSIIKKPAPAPPAPPAPVPKEDLYDMILTTQAQGRLEDQRSRAPGPMDDEDFFSLLLRVQGGRMDEQRTQLPCMLQT